MSLKISRILHAGYVFECGLDKIAFDPIFEIPFSKNCYAYPNVSFDIEQIKNLKFSAVFISHYHDDHCSLESLNLLDKNTPIYIYCLFEELLDWIRELGFKNVQSIHLNESIWINSIEVIPRKALDENVDSIFEINASGLKVLNVVDSWIDPQTLDELVHRGPWDMVLWPFQTMREIEVIAPSRSVAAPQNLPPEWTDQIKKLNPKYIVPSSCQFIHESWSWYKHAFFPITYKQFQKEVQALLPQAKIVRMNPSVSFVLNSNSIASSSPLSWITPLGEQDVDYQYDRNFQPTPTSEIALQFAGLTQTETDKVLKYCCQDLIQKYKSMDEPEDKYFSKTRLWQLSIYDDKGVEIVFYYKLKGHDIQLIEQIDEPIAWFTEIPLAKFYAALEEGESLTSIYIRINDIAFDPQIEKEIAEVDVLEDPLVRCLFNGEFGAYQKYQLKKLKSNVI